MRTALLAAVVLLGHPRAGADRDLVSPFDLQHVELHPDSDFYKQAALNEDFMLSISNDEVSHLGRARPLPQACSASAVAAWLYADICVTCSCSGHFAEMPICLPLGSPWAAGKLQTVRSGASSWATTSAQWPCCSGRQVSAVADLALTRQQTESLHVLTWQQPGTESTLRL